MTTKQLWPPGTLLVDARPDLAAEWHPDNPQHLQTVTAGSGITVRWRCSQSHEWLAKVQNRVRGQGTCGYCTGKKATPATSLAALCPAIAAEWHPMLNGDLRPDQVRPGSDRRVAWRCVAGHEWRASIQTRTSKDSRCEYCSGRLASPENNLRVLRPGLAAEWHPTLNGELTPADVVLGSNRRVWWRCPLRHVWQTKVLSRTQPGGSGCPDCAPRGHLSLSLAEVAPDLLKEWHVPLNHGPGDDVAAGAAWKAWWCCETAGHVWAARVQSRSKRKTGCP